MTKHLPLWLASLAALALYLVPGRALAMTYQFCAQLDVSYTDNGYGEDFLTSDGPIQAPGIRTRVRYYPSCSTAGAYTEYVPSSYSDANGCTESFVTPHTDGCFLFTAYTYGRVPDTGTYVYGRNDDGLVAYQSVWVDPSNNIGGKQWAVFPELHRYRLYGTLAYIMTDNFEGSLSGGSINAYTTADPDDCGCSTSNPSPGSRWCPKGSSTGNICLTPYGRERKFVIAHEYGHHNLHFTAGDWTSDCGSGGGHGMTTYEYQSCAMMEGWANFVSADSWNDVLESNNPGGKLRYWGSCGGSGTIDVETTGNGAGCVDKYMENNWSAASWPGHGNELDWMRTYWDYHTNDAASSPGYTPSHTQMQADFAGQLPQGTPDRECAYDMYRQGVADAQSCGQYQRMVYYAEANGADHCEDEGTANWCDNVVGCTDVD